MFCCQFEFLKKGKIGEKNKLPPSGLVRSRRDEGEVERRKIHHLVLILLPPNIAPAWPQGKKKENEANPHTVEASHHHHTLTKFAECREFFFSLNTGNASLILWHKWNEVWKGEGATWKLIVFSPAACFYLALSLSQTVAWLFRSLLVPNTQINTYWAG